MIGKASPCQLVVLTVMESVIFQVNRNYFCLDKIGDRNKAVSVMEKGLKKVGGDELMSSNLEALKSGGKMKMQGYGDLWLQFQLEKQGAMIRKQTKAMQGRRKIVRR